ncbi:MAG TPA: outer membrane beta-barrel protein [Vicinamibacterales bacterium]
MLIRALLLAVLCVMVLPATSRAQERGQVGLTMGFPTAAGFIWHATGRLAVRPEITFAQATSKADASLPNASVETSSRSLAYGASLLWYFGASDNVRPYVSPRVVYSRLTTEDSRPSLPGADDDDDDPAGTVAVSGALGVQYTPARRFAVFGEVGVARAHTEQTRDFPGIITVTTSVTSWSTRGAVGVIWYFGG